MLQIKQDSFFKDDLCIKYLTGWHRQFTQNNGNGNLLFYQGNPLYLVDVSIFSDRNNLREEDILITTGEHHNASDIKERIISHTDTIYEMCKSSIASEFVLNLDKMKVVERVDFVLSHPIMGLNSFFIFDNLNNDKFYCLVNPATNINNNELFAWFLSYVYAGHICLSPRNKVEDYSKQFMQAISMLAFNGGNRSRVKIASRDSILRCELNHTGEVLFEVPGDNNKGNNTKRFQQLVTKAFEQMGNHASKKGRK